MDKEQINENGMNKHAIYCKFCESMILQPNKAKFLEHEISLHKFNGNEIEVLNNTWYVTDVFDFENIAVMRKVNNELVGEGEFKYLSCADCERGPVGIKYLNNTKEHYIEHSRIRYKE